MIEKMPEESAERYSKLLKSLDNSTPTEFFSIAAEYMKVFAPSFEEERANDLQDNKEFFPISFAELHKRDEAAVK